MIYKPIYFDLEELVCPHVFKKYGNTAWQFFDSRLLITIDKIRERIGKPVFINDWNEGGKLDERGFRCIQCDTVNRAIAENKLYVSPHMTGQAVDFDVQGLLAEEVRQWIIKNQNLWPYPIRLEAGVSWIHVDTRDAEQGKVYLFNL